MNKGLIPVVLAFTLATSATAEASLFTLDSYSVALRNHDPGLVLWEIDLLPVPVSFNLSEVGDYFTTSMISLFRVGTNESALNVDDVVPYGIDVAFSFSTPAPNFGGTANGITRGRMVISDLRLRSLGQPARAELRD